MKGIGGCMCGAVRYECDEEPISAGTCHCRTCQGWTGSACHAFVGFPTTTLRFTKGEPKIYEAPGAVKERGSDAGTQQLQHRHSLIHESKGVDP